MSDRKITSTVITKAGDWADESYLIPHEPIRWDLLESQRLLDLKYFDGTVQWKVDNWYKWYDLFYQIVHHHHDTEEQIAFPLIKAKAKDVPDRLAKDHEGLLKMMDDIKESKKNFEKAKTVDEKRKAGDTLRTLWNALVKEMLEHLAEEERVLCPLIRKHMTEKEHDQMVNTILSQLGLSGNKLMLPWITRAMKVWKGEEETAKFSKMIPAPIRFLNDYFWTASYEGENWGMLHSLEKNEPPKGSSSMLTAGIVVAAAVTVGAVYYMRNQV